MEIVKYKLNEKDENNVQWWALECFYISIAQLGDRVRPISATITINSQKEARNPPKISKIVDLKLISRMTFPRDSLIIETKTNLNYYPGISLISASGLYHLRCKNLKPLLMRLLFF